LQEEQFIGFPIAASASSVMHFIGTMNTLVSTLALAFLAFGREAYFPSPGILTY